MATRKGLERLGERPLREEEGHARLAVRATRSTPVYRRPIVFDQTRPQPDVLGLGAPARDLKARSG